MEIEARGVAIGKGGGREREKGPEHRRKRRRRENAFRISSGSKFPQKPKGFCIKTAVLKQTCNEWMRGISSSFTLIICV